MTNERGAVGKKNSHDATSFPRPDPDARRAWCAWPAGEYELCKFFRTYETAASYARSQREDDCKVWCVGKTVAQFADLEVAQAYALGQLM